MAYEPLDIKNPRNVECCLSYEAAEMANEPSEAGLIGSTLIPSQLQRR